MQTDFDAPHLNYLLYPHTPIPTPLLLLVFTAT